jgi:cytochrome c
MKKLLVFALVGLFLFVGLAYAQKKATKDSCQALVKKAVEHVKKVGKEQALKDFSAPSTMFVDGEDYLSIYDMKAAVIGHGTNASLIGKNLYDMKDSHGNFFMREFVEKANKPGATGWVEYHWTNPVSKKIEPKAAYFVRVDDMIIQAGYYK